MTPRCVGQRIDTFHVFGDVVVREGVFLALKEARQRMRTDRLEELPFEFAGQRFVLQAGGSRRGGYVLRNADLTLTIRYLAPNVKVEFGAMACATHRLAELVATAEAIIGQTGEVESIVVGRLDLAADFVGLAFERVDAHAFVTRSRSGADYAPDSVRTFWKPTEDLQLTGFTFSLGSPVAARLYDKTEELRRPETHEDKRAVEHARWNAQGWDGTEQVWRVEFEIRDFALNELRLRALATLEDKLDESWQYLTRHWLRLIEPGSASRRERSETDARWLAVQGVVFKHAHVKPAVRERKQRGGASAAMAIGCLLSLAGGTNAIDDAVAKRGRPSTWTQADLLAVVASIAEAAGQQLLDAKGLEALVLQVETQWNRFAEMKAKTVAA